MAIITNPNGIPVPIPQPAPNTYTSPSLANYGMTPESYLQSLQVPAAPSTPNALSGISATEGGRATIGGQTYVARDGQWVPASAGGGTSPQGTSTPITNPFGGSNPFMQQVTGTQMLDDSGNVTAPYYAATPGNPNVNYATEEGAKQLAALLGLQTQYIAPSGLNPFDQGIWGLVNAQGEVTPAGQVALMAQRGDTLNQIRQYLGYSPTQGGGGYGTGVMAPGSFNSSGAFTPNPNGNGVLPTPGPSVGSPAPSPQTTTSAPTNPAYAPGGHNLDNPVGYPGSGGSPVGGGWFGSGPFGWGNNFGGFNPFGYGGSFGGFGSGFGGWGSGFGGFNGGGFSQTPWGSNFSRRPQQPSFNSMQWYSPWR